MLTLIEIYVIGMCVAFVMAIILAFHYERTRKEEQQWGMTAVAAILSWLAVGMFIWSYRHDYKHFFKWMWTSVQNAVAKFF